MRFGAVEQQRIEAAARSAKLGFDPAADHPPVQHQTWMRQQWQMMGMQQQYGTGASQDGQQQQPQHPDEARRRQQQQDQQQQIRKASL